MKKATLLGSTLLLFISHGMCMPLEAVARKNPYQINTQVVNRQGKVKNADVTIMFTFAYKNEPKITVQRFIELSKNYDAHLQATMVELTRAIRQQADAYMLWDGFATTAKLASKDANRPFTIIMRGRCQPHKRDPKDRSDRFMQHQGPAAGKYREVRAKSTDERFTKAFDEHIATALQQDKDAQNVVFTSPGGSTLLVIPMMRATTIYDVGKEATEAQIISYWRTILAVLHRYGALIKHWRFNTGETCAGQTVPHMHLRNGLVKAFSEDKQVLAWEANGKVTFRGVEPFVTSQKASVQDGEQPAPPFWQRPESIGMVGVFVVLVAWLYTSEVSDEEEEVVRKKRRTKQRTGWKRGGDGKVSWRYAPWAKAMEGWYVPPEVLFLQRLHHEHDLVAPLYPFGMHVPWRVYAVGSCC